jgi:hypothetical protein
VIPISCNGSLDGCGQTLQTSATVSNSLWHVRTIFREDRNFRPSRADLIIRDECENSFDYESAASSSPELHCLLRLFHLSVLV